MPETITLEAVTPAEVYLLPPDTNLLYRFKGVRVYMSNSARSAQSHKFAEAMAECYLLPNAVVGEDL